MASPSPTPPVKAEAASQQAQQTPAPDEDDPVLASDVESDGDPLDDQDSPDETTNYNESAEPLPKAVVYDPEFKDVHKATLRLVAEVANAVPEDSRDRARFKHLLTRARELAQFPITRKRRINLVGKSGSGKSSLLNSVIGIPGHAKAIAGSKACTHVPTTYEGAFKDQKQFFAVIIEFFAEDECRSLMEQAVSDYYDFFDSDHECLEEEEIMKLQTAADTALETFRTLFGRKRDFATLRNTEDFLAQASGDENAKRSIIGKFVRWCNALIAESGVSDGSYYQTDDESDLRSYIQQFAFSNSKRDQWSLWPLVKTIREGIAGIDILKYVSLVDWPGSDDTNQMRAKASAQRIYDCDEIWIVSNADRIATDPAATVNLVRYGKTIPCVLICTSIDDKVDDALVEEMDKDGCDVGDYWEISAAIESTQKEIQSSKNRLEKLEQALNRGWVPTKSNKRKQLDDDMRARYKKASDENRARMSESNDKHEQMEQARFELAVQVRQTYVLGLIEKKNLQRHTPRLRVLFASNTHYTRHKAGSFAKGPTLSPDATGIPNIRQHILKSAAPRELQIVKNYLNNDVKLLINGIGLVTNTVDPQGCEDALIIVERRQEDVDRARLTILERFDVFMQENVVQSLALRQGDHSKSALKVLDKKRNWAWGSIRAFVSQHGCHKTKSQPYHSWTEQFMHEAVEDLTGLWNDFMHAEDVARNIKDLLVDECNSIVEALDRHESSFRIQQDDFKQFIDGQIGRVEASCAEFEEAFTQALRIIFIEATQADDQCPTGYFYKALQHAWKEAASITGAGAKARMLTVLETHLKLHGDQSPFAVLRNDMTAAILDSASRLMDELTAKVKSILIDIHHWLQAMFY